MRSGVAPHDCFIHNSTCDIHLWLQASLSPDTIKKVTQQRSAGIYNYSHYTVKSVRSETRLAANDHTNVPADEALGDYPKAAQHDTPRFGRRRKGRIKQRLRPENTIKLRMLNVIFSSEASWKIAFSSHRKHWIIEIVSKRAFSAC